MFDRFFSQFPPCIEVGAQNERLVIIFQQDQQGEQIYLGINHTGISTFQGSRKSTHFKWTQITKLNFEAKMFIVHLSIAEDARTKVCDDIQFLAFD